MGMQLNIQNLAVVCLGQEQGWYSQRRADRGLMEEVGSSRSREAITIVESPPRGQNRRVTVSGGQWTDTRRIVDRRGPVQDGRYDKRSDAETMKESAGIAETLRE